MKKAENRVCPICSAGQSSGIQQWHSVCRECGYESASLAPNINAQHFYENIDEAARESGLKHLRQANFRKLVHVLRAAHPQARSLLDVGSAHGWFLEAAAGSFEVLGIEPDKAVYEAAKAREPRIRLGFFPDVLHQDERFDIIAFNDVFEHIPDSAQVLASCRERLTQGGILLLNLPSSKGLFYRLSKAFHRLGYSGFFDRLWQKDMPSPHLHYFNAENLSHFVRQHQFSVVDRGSLPTVRLAGLYARISHARNMNPLIKMTTYACIALALPVLRLLPSDIIYVVARQR